MKVVLNTEHTILFSIMCHFYWGMALLCHPMDVSCVHINQPAKAQSQLTQALMGHEVIPSEHENIGGW